MAKNKTPKVKPPKLAYEKGKGLFVSLMLFVPLLNFVVFWVYVNFSSIMLAFKQTTLDGVKYTFDNFRMLWSDITNTDSIIIPALVNTLIFFSVSLFIILPMCLMFSYFLYKKVLGYKWFRFIFFLPSIISATVLTSLYKYLVSPNGTIPLLYEALLGKQAPQFLADSDYALWTIVIYTIWTGFGVNIVIYTGAMSRIPDSVIESAQIEGVGIWKEMFHIIMPMIWPTISTTLTFAMVGIFTASGPILLFTKGNYGTYTLSYWIFEQVNDFKVYEYSSAVGLFFTVIGLPIVLISRHFINKVQDDVEY